MPRTPVIHYNGSRDSEEVMAGPLERVQDNSYQKLFWRVRYTKMTERWEAKNLTPEDRYETYTIRSTGFPSLVRVSYRAAGLPRKAKARHLASVETFALAVICAEDHHRRLTNGRRADHKREQA